ncbi:NUDIX hydrolase [Mangrovicoccus algicola]|uniref:NUDIX hydrolase n=1 Tax=Mangrovicoccus algicola TaxID=2771008 RepID=A0A8J7CZG7_9RHOB|nr:NUDIX hydrolase [Mangrovicoccus algicola]MBE3637858.1 NUDIX hydrolase [Mangrovicoccus algicola]
MTGILRAREPEQEARAEFAGAKLALFIGDRLLVCLRDDIATIPFPGQWDFPGGGREGRESPEATALRETREEFGLVLDPGDLARPLAHRSHEQGWLNWFFVAHLPATAEAAIRFGDEGQCWRLIPPRAYLRNPRRIPHLAALLADYLDSVAHG